MAPPLIVTLLADPTSQARFQAARDRWFPPDRNVVPAHLTLFHHLPGAREPDVLLRLGHVARDVPPLPIRVTGILAMGRGAGYRLDVPGWAALRSRIGAGFELTAQDAAAGRPHVTVQNKVTKEEAAATVETLRAGFAPWEGTGIALQLWRYRGGPWEAAGRFDLRGSGS